MSRTKIITLVLDPSARTESLLGIGRTALTEALTHAIEDENFGDVLSITIEENEGNASPEQD